MAPIFALPKNRAWSVGQGVKTPPFHGGITGSIPVRSTGKGKVVNPKCSDVFGISYFVLWCMFT
jgi:hypothetical protein